MQKRKTQVISTANDKVSRKPVGFQEKKLDSQLDSIFLKEIGGNVLLISSLDRNYCNQDTGETENLFFLVSMPSLGRKKEVESKSERDRQRQK